MPVNCVAIRDASLTTKFKVQKSLAAYRNVGYPQGFPVGNAFVPEQFRNRVSAEVPVLAKQGACFCEPDSIIFNPLDGNNGYGFQAPSNVANVQ
jgi:hypothetical protein